MAGNAQAKVVSTNSATGNVLESGVLSINYVSLTIGPSIAFTFGK